MWPFSTIRRLTAERDQARALTEAHSDLLKALRAKLKQAHFRNPKTGRLGKKGQTFD
jgi:hypothetical protein